MFNDHAAGSEVRGEKSEVRVIYEHSRIINGHSRSVADNKKENH